MKNNLSWPREDEELGIRMRQEGYSWRQIGERLCRHESTVASYIRERMISHEELRAKRDRACDLRRVRKADSFPSGHRACREPASPEALAERSRALSEPMSLTGELLGDPPPSRSALYSKQGGGYHGTV